LLLPYLSKSSSTLKFKFAKPPKKQNQKLRSSNKLQHLATLQAKCSLCASVAAFQNTNFRTPKNISLELELASTTISSFYTAAAAGVP
jgi:hypothetical protein